MDESSRAPDLSIDAKSGELGIGTEVRLKAGQTKADIEKLLAPWAKGERDMRTGYVWLDLGGMRFGGEPASLSLCFHQDRLTQMSWSVRLPDASSEGGWPTREAIDQEISFVRDVLADQVGYERTRDAMTFGGAKFGAASIQRAFWRLTDCASVISGPAIHSA